MAADSLMDGFRDPPNGARPRVWWHWLDGNVTKEGITLDLESEKGRIFVDLGSVKNLAEVSVNGKPLGIVWKEPFRVDVTDALRPGENALAIKVMDLRVNRLIGDLQNGTADKCAFVSPPPAYLPGSPLLPAGLLGPVKMVRFF